MVSGLITLLTDFGTDDPFVGVMKGVISSRFPAARVIDDDLTHGACGDREEVTPVLQLQRRGLGQLQIRLMHEHARAPRLTRRMLPQCPLRARVPPVINRRAPPGECAPPSRS